MTFSLTEKRIKVSLRGIYSTGIGIKQLLFDKFKKCSYSRCFHSYK